MSDCILNSDQILNNVYDEDGKLIRTSSIQAFTPPANADAITAEYPSTTVEIYRYREGGITGTILNSVTVTYTSSSKRDILNLVWS